MSVHVAVGARVARTGGCLRQPVLCASGAFPRPPSPPYDGARTVFDVDLLTLRVAGRPEIVPTPFGWWLTTTVTRMSSAATVAGASGATLVLVPWTKLVPVGGPGAAI